MASEVFQLALLLTLKDAASGGLDRFEARLRAAGKAGDKFHSDFQKIRDDLNKDLAIGGVGIAGLATLGKGVKIAADFQSSMTELRSTMSATGQDGKVNMQQLADRMLRSEAVAIRLGNALPGTTEDFIQMMQVLKQNGLEAETIIGGAADAVGNLAVATNSVPREIAADFARFGNLYKLNADDYTKAADVFSRIYTSTGQTSGDLIEAAKYFQGRAGQQLGIGGLKDAEQWTRLYGFMGKQGMQGSMAGMGLTNFFQQYTSHRDKLKDLEKETGIKLNFFDKAGKFVGLEEVITQMGQFDKLTPEKRTAWMDELFGTLGSGAANVLANTAAWKQFNAEQDQTISLSNKTAEASKNFNNQLEALTGTGKNLVVAVFEPILPDLTSITKGLNEATGAVQGFVKDHPTVAKYAVSFAAIGSAALVAYSGIKLLTTGVRIFKIASAFSKSEGILGYLNQTDKATTVVGRNIDGLTPKQRALQQLGGTLVTTDKKVGGLVGQLDNASKKTGKLRGDLFSLNNVFKAVLVLEAVGFTWNQIAELKKTVNDWQAMNKGLDSTGKSSYHAYQGVPADQKNPRAEAQSMMSLLQAGNQEFSKALDPTKTTWWERAIRIGTPFPLYQGGPSTAEIVKTPEYSARVETLRKRPVSEQTVDSTFANVYARVSAEIAGVKNLRERAPSLADPQVMSSFRKDVVPTLGLSPERTNFLDQMLKQAFPESFAASLSGISTSAESFSQALSSLQPPVDGVVQALTGLPQPVTMVGDSLNQLPGPIEHTQRSFVEVYNSANRLPGGFNNVLFSTNNVANSLDGLSVKIASWQPPASPAIAAPGTPPGGIVAFPGRASGGVVERPGFAFVHPGNVITPAGVTRGLPGFASLMSLARRRSENSHPFAFAANIKFADQSPVSASSIFSRPLDADGLSGRSKPSSFVTPEPTAVHPSVLTAGGLNSRGAAEQPVSITYSPKITIQGNADERTVDDIQGLLLEERKAIARMIRKELANGRARA